MEKYSIGKEQSSQKAPRNLDPSKYPPVEIKRTLRASPQKVWDAWSKPELMKQWWGPAGYSCPKAEIDFRVGGKHVSAMKAPDGKVSWSGGTYFEIEPLKRIVCTDAFCDENGNPVAPSTYGMPGDWPDKLLVTVEFERSGSHETIMRLKHEGIPKDMHDDCVQEWSSSLDKMAKLVEEKQFH